MGLIYISRNKDSVIIEGNQFNRNIGLFGGAITINSPDWRYNKAVNIILNNKFTQNMAYLSGNAIYIRNTK